MVCTHTRPAAKGSAFMHKSKFDVVFLQAASKKPSACIVQSVLVQSDWLAHTTTRGFARGKGQAWMHREAAGARWAQGADKINSKGERHGSAHPRSLSIIVVVASSLTVGPRDDARDRTTQPAVDTKKMAQGKVKGTGT